MFIARVLFYSYFLHLRQNITFHSSRTGDGGSIYENMNSTTQCYDTSINFSISNMVNETEQSLNSTCDIPRLVSFCHQLFHLFAESYLI